LKAQKCPVGTENPPSGGASIASGYTLDAFAGAKPRHPLPPKGEKGNVMQKKKTAIVTARMTPKVKELLQQRAQDADMTLTDYLCMEKITTSHTRTPSVIVATAL